MTKTKDKSSRSAPARSGIQPTKNGKNADPTVIPGSQPEKVVATAGYPAPSDPIQKAKDRAVASFATRSSVNAAGAMESFVEKSIPGVTIAALTDELEQCLAEVAAGDMTQPEKMLMGQAFALQSMFLNFSRRAPAQEYIRNLQTYMTLALKAQNQCRMTLETLSLVKNPRQVAFIRTDQANVSNGPQQVNNHPPARAQNQENRPNELLEQTNGERLEQRATAAAEPSYSAVETLDPLDGPENGDRQDSVRAKRVPGRKRSGNASRGTRADSQNDRANR